MPDERDSIHELRLQLTALLQHSGATPGCKTIAALMAAAYACRAANMPPALLSRGSETGLTEAEIRRSLALGYQDACSWRPSMKLRIAPNAVIDP